MHFQVKTQENGGNNIFNDKQETNKVTLLFLDSKVVTES